MSTLYELTGMGLDMEEMLMNDECSEEAFIDSMEAWEEDFNAKIETLLKVYTEVSAKATAHKPEIDRLTKNMKTLENKADWIKHYVFEAMQKLNYKEAGGDLIKAKIVNNGGKQPLVFDVDDDHVPEEFKAAKYYVDKDLVRGLLEEGNTLEFAHLGERGQSLRIK